MNRLQEIQTADPFPHYDAELRRMREHLSGLDLAGWNAASHCQGWSVKDVLAHLAAGEAYNQACLDGTLRELSFSGGIDAWNARAVAERRDRTPGEVMEEWAKRQADVRERWGRLGADARIPTSVGLYPLRLQVRHLAQEYATHADDIGVPVPDQEREARVRWRCAFGLFARREEGRPLEVRVDDGGVVLKGNHELDMDSFLALLTERPQHLADARRRQRVEALLRDRT
ncbi:MAG TPA: maleylpyruvate isomerase family mycothiol-dependent enzyme [Candidatus Dormibacteraeota bacterium]|nr:maleylpyruvate isomerase family mycothiol-dependent enzyme [Candidatus Dormibacteraeota bacterium]